MRIVSQGVNLVTYDIQENQVDVTTNQQFVKSEHSYFLDFAQNQ